MAAMEMRNAMQHISISIGLRQAAAVCLERSVGAPEFIHDVIHSLGALSVFPTERTDVLSACQFFLKVHEIRCYDCKPWKNAILEGSVCQRRV